MNALALTLAAIAVRNPFWTIGYEGVREEISAEPKVEVTTTVTDGEDTATAATAAAHAPVPQERVSPLPRSHTRIERVVSFINMTNSVFTRSGNTS